MKIAPSLPPCLCLALSSMDCERVRYSVSQHCGLVTLRLAICQWHTAQHAAMGASKLNPKYLLAQIRDFIRPPRIRIHTPQAIVLIGNSPCRGCAVESGVCHSLCGARGLLQIKN
jgi:hypothetical protein